MTGKAGNRQSGKQAKGRVALGVILALATIGVITYSVFNSDAFDTSLSSAMGELKELSAGNGKEASDVPQENEDDGVALYESGMKYYAGNCVEKDKDKAVAKQAVQRDVVNVIAKVAEQKAAKCEVTGDIVAIIAKLATGTAEMDECPYC